MLLPDGLSTNAYRVLRLSANASSSEVHKAAERARRAFALGMPPANDVDVGLLGALPQSDADIRAAVSRLGNPSHRLKERLFWFHEVPGADIPDPSAPDAAFAIGDLVENVRRHDEALRGLFNAFRATLDDEGAALWVRGLRRWHAVASDDSYWALSLAVENRGGFVPPALPGEMESLRFAAMSDAAHGLLVEGRDAINRNDAATIQRVLKILRELSGTGSWANLAHDEFASSAVAEFIKRCREIRETGSGKMVREKFAFAANLPVAEATLDRFRKEVDSKLKKLLPCFPDDHILGRRVREAAAQCLYGVATDFTWADRFTLSVALHEEALVLARGTSLAAQIESGLARARASARDQSIFETRKSASADPSVGTVLGFGGKLYGSSDYDSASKSYVTTHYLVGLFVPLFPLGRYRVIKSDAKPYRYLGKLPFRNADRLHQAIAVTALLIWFSNSYTSNHSRDLYPSSTSSYNPSAYPVSSDTSANVMKYDSAGVPDFSDILTPRTDQSDSSAKKPAASPTPVRADPWAVLDKPATVGTSSSSADLRARLIRDSTRLTEFKAQLHSEGAAIDALDTRIRGLKSELSVMNEQIDEDSPAAVEDFNNKVDRHNTLLRRQRLLLAAYEADLGRGEEMVVQFNHLVDQYNARIR